MSNNIGGLVAAVKEKEGERWGYAEEVAHRNLWLRIHRQKDKRMIIRKAIKDQECCR